MSDELPPLVAWAKEQPDEKRHSDNDLRAAIAAAVAKERHRLIPERDEIGKVLCSVADNLGDLPISNYWADAISRRATALLVRNDYFRVSAIRRGE